MVSQYVDKWNFFRLAYSGYWIALVVHGLSCGWYALRPDAGTHGVEHYVGLSMVCDHADVWVWRHPPLTDLEILYAVFVMAAGVGMFGYVIGNIAHILAHLHPSRVRYVETMEGINAFMDYRGLPAGLQRRIRDFYSYRWEKRLGFDESAILNDLSPSLQGDVSLFLKRDVIQKVPFFQGATDELIREIALAMRPQVYMPGDLVFRAGEKGAEMFFIGRGEVEVLAKDGVTVQATLRDGQFFGEGALVLGQPRSASVRAVGFCDLYALDKVAFEGIISRYPEFAEHIGAMIRERFGQSR
jgi:voltage-gated potassium channel